ncbi:uncharacterized protein LOC120352613 [Nilaparvata lugens]|uniref:uncharacterized protein LOC120352613 n=1 Tax=Nilaparvata lugens TaxID=108931 RepID=UPI00193D45FC|nr:uncharacterized protein LOC120352613 [Nilaparvata lugens]
MDLRTIIASCLIPVLFGFLAEAIPPHYYSQSPAALPTSDDDTLQGMFGSFEEPKSSEYDGNHKSENSYKNPEASEWLEENGNKEQNGINRKGIPEWQDLIDNNEELMLGGNQNAVATLRHRTEMGGKLVTCRRGFVYDPHVERCRRKSNAHRYGHRRSRPLWLYYLQRVE